MLGEIMDQLSSLRFSPVSTKKENPELEIQTQMQQYIGQVIMLFGSQNLEHLEIIFVHLPS